MRLLLVEDDLELSRRLSDRLRQSGFAVDLAANAADAIEWPDLNQFATIILDLGLPDGDGMEVVKRWRDTGIKVPVLILTARGDWVDKVEGLNRGADDFVVKPVRFEELLARLHALFRRFSGQADDLLNAGGITIDAAAKSVKQGSKQITLSRQEFRLLHLFVRRAGHILPQSYILEDLYSLEEEREQNTIEVHISRLRRKIGKEKITTIRGMGYRFEK